MRRAKGYQDLDDNAVGLRPQAPPMPLPQEIEMASVSVVPDGMYLLPWLTKRHWVKVLSRTFA